MSKTIVIIGTLDTKGDQIEYIKNAIEGRGHEVILVDIGVMGKPMCAPDITNHQIARASGISIEEIIAFKDEAKAMDNMTEGAIKIIKELLEQRNVDGLLVAGGSMGTSSALKIMQELPLDMPKVLLSTLSYSHAIDPDLAANGIIMIQWAGGLWGINEKVRKVLEQSAAVVSASSEVYEKKDTNKKRKKICITSLGASASIYMKNLRPALKERNIDPVVYHPTGMNTRVMEKTIREGYFDAVLDLGVSEELIGYICGSLLGGAPDRMDAAADMGIPQIVQIDPSMGDAICLWAPNKPIPPEFENNMRFVHNDLLWPLVVNPEQTVEMMELLVRKLNRAKGPTALLATKKPFVGEDDTAGSEVKKQSNPERMETLLNIARENLKPEIKLIELDISAYDPELSIEIIKVLDEMMPA